MKPKNKQILLGSILGDGGIYIQKSCKNPRYKETHSVKQKNYLLWKIENLSYDLGEFNTNEYEQYGHTLFQGQTRVNPFLNKFIDLEFEEILKELDLLGFLVWYLDDGSFDYRSNCLKLDTKDYPNTRIIEWGKKKFDIEFKTTTTKENKLRLDVSDTKKLISKLNNVFNKYNLPSCMEYKLGLDEEREKEAREKEKEQQKRYYEENKDKILKKQRKQYEEHRGENTKKVPNWTDEEINILKNNYEDMTIRELSEILDRTKKSIYSKKYRLKKRINQSI